MENEKIWNWNWNEIEYMHRFLLVYDVLLPITSFLFDSF